MNSTRSYGSIGLPSSSGTWRLRHAVASIQARLTGQGIHFVVTTTTAQQLSQVGGAVTPMLEIVGKPYNLDTSVDAVRRANDFVAKAMD